MHDTTKRTKNYTAKFPSSYENHSESNFLNSQDEVGQKLNLIYYSEKDKSTHQIINYIYCPYLFLNTSGFKLNLHEKFKTELKSHEIKSYFNYHNNQNQNEKLEEKEKNRFASTLYKVSMFNPNEQKHFKFNLNTIVEKNPISHSKIKGEIAEKEKDDESNELSAKINLEDVLTKPKQVELKKQEDFINFDVVKTIQSTLEKIKFDNDKKIKKREFPINNNSKSRTNRCRLAIQSKVLDGCLRFSKLIFITPQLLIKNYTKRDIYLYHVSVEDGFIYHSDCIREGKIKKN